MKKLKERLGVVLIAAFFIFLWGSYIGNLLIGILYFIFPDNWINPLADIFYTIYPGLLEYHDCTPDFMGGCS